MWRILKLDSLLDWRSAQLMSFTQEWGKEKSQEASGLPFQFTLLRLQFDLAYLATPMIVMTNCKSNHANCGFFRLLCLSFFQQLLKYVADVLEVTCCYPQRHPTSNCFQKPFPMIFGRSRSSFASYEEGAFFSLSVFAKRVTLSHANYPMSHHYLCITAP